jgi:hypothetical protein
MGFFKKRFVTKHDTIPVSGPDETIRDLPRPEEKKYDPAKRVDMTREELIAGINELEKTDKEKANALRRAFGMPEKP